MTNPQEETLTGGTLTPVVKVGNTVRRPAQPWTPTVHALLHHLHTVGFSGAPEALGIDEQNREILSFIPGEVANWPFPQTLRENNGIVQYAQLLRNYHEAVSTFTLPANAQWQQDSSQLKPGEIVRHGDVGPWNTVWLDGNLMGLIDWDFVGPGTAKDDVLQAIWHAVPLYGDELCRLAGFAEPPNRAQRIQTFLDTYGNNFGLTNSHDVITAVHEYAEQELATNARLAAEKREPWATLYARMEDLGRKYDWLREHSASAEDRRAGK